MNKPIISVLGLGLIGTAIAKTFNIAGRSVIVWNRTAGKATNLKSENINVANNCRQAIELGDIIFVATKDYATSRPLFENVEISGKILIQMATGAPKDAREFGYESKSRGARYLDVAIKRGPVDFGTGRGAMFFSGELDLFQELQPILGSLGGRLVFLGSDFGMAKAFDLATFARSYCWLFGYLEAAAIAKEFGLDLAVATEHMLSVVSSTFRFIERAVPEIQSDTFSSAVSASVATHYSALSKTIVAAQSQGLRTPLLEVIQSYMEQTIANGLGDREIAACFRAVASDRNVE
jgi:3-hydroxyisobutyrate dehydrogenase-like beta-hydroxyacid dehydrogenase